MDKIRISLCFHCFCGSIERFYYYLRKKSCYELGLLCVYNIIQHSSIQESKKMRKDRMKMSVIFIAHTVQGEIPP